MTHPKCTRAADGISMLRVDVSNIAAPKTLKEINGVIENYARMLVIMFTLCIVLIQVVLNL